MTWSYSNTLTASKDKIRLMIGDTDTTDQQLQDEEITYALTIHTSIYSAAFLCVGWLVAKYSRQVDKAVGDLRLFASKRYEHYLQLQKQIQRQGLISGLLPYAGGLSQAEKDTNIADTDLVQPKFRIDTMVNPRV